MWLDLVFISGIRFFVVWMLSVFVVWCVLWSSHVEKGVVLSGWCVSPSHCLLCRFYSRRAWLYGIMDGCIWLYLVDDIMDGCIWLYLVDDIMDGCIWIYLVNGIMDGCIWQVSGIMDDNELLC